MAPKKTNIKIKHSKFNLYNKKKSKARRALRIFVTVIVVCGLGVLGYGLGKPLLKYIQEKGKNPASSNTSAILSGIMNSVGENSAGGSSMGIISSAETSEPAPVPLVSENVWYLDDNAALSEANLTAALAAAKNSGCSVVAVTVKDTAGSMLYKTNIDKIKDTDVVSGTLTAEQIAAQITKEGFTPAARINTLMDKLAHPYNDGGYRIVETQGGGSWHDNRPENGGKYWLSPFNSNAIKYIGDISDELTKAGFKHVICANTRFPAFHTVDISTYLTQLPLKDTSKRVEALWNVVNSAKTNAEKNGGDIILEISASCILAESKSCLDAELTLDREKLKTVPIIINYDIMRKGTGTASTTSAPAVSAPTTSTSTTSTSTTSKPTTSTTTTSTSTTSTATTSTSTASTATTSTPTVSAPTVSAPTTSTTTTSRNTSTVTVTSTALAAAGTSGTTSSANTSGSTKVDYTGTPGAPVTTVPTGTSDYDMAKSFITAAKTALGDAEFSVRISPSLDSTARADVTRAFTEANINVF